MFLFALRIFNFQNIKDSDPSKSFVYAWNPCTKFTQGDGCKDVLVSTVSKKDTLAHKNVVVVLLGLMKIMIA